jgi:flagellin
MGIRINENLFSLFVRRSLTRTSGKLDQAFSRLSSGEKINSSGDDPAGLANSHVLRAKIAGLQRNLVNCNQGLNLLSISESSLGNVTEILQRLRELGVQAATATISQEQRLLIQKEADSLIEEMQRIATTANYNGKNLLDGTFTGLRLQLGTRTGESIPVAIEDSRPSALGAMAHVTGATGVSVSPITGSGDLTINGFTVPASALDGLSTIYGDASAIAKAAAINTLTNSTGVTAKAEAAVYMAAGASITGGALDGTATSLTINGVNIGAITVDSGDANGVLQNRINSFTSLTGVTATRGPAGELVLTAEDGRNVQITTTGSAADELGLRVGNGDVNTVAGGTVSLSSAATINVGGTLALIGFTAGQAATFVDPATAISFLQLITADQAQAALDTIDVALQQILERRAALGAIESRLNTTIDDLMVNVENLTGADSRIRDADFAVETANLTQAQIIQQAGIAILAQANMIPQMALNLLQK